MGRMFDVLKNKANNDKPPQPSEEAKPAAATADGGGNDAVLEQREEELPFIELNGLTRTIEGSPDVLAQPIVLPEPDTPAETIAEDDAATVEMNDTQPGQSSGIVFEPWPETGHPTQVSSELVAFHQPQNPVSKRYSELLHQILDGETLPQTLLFTGTGDRSAIALTTLNLGVIAATKFSQNTVIVDITSGEPTDASLLGLPNVPGLQDVLEGRAALEQALHKSRLANLSVITLWNHSSNDTSLSAKEALRWLMSFLSERFDLVFIDGGVWRNHQPLSTAAELCDAVLPVVAAAHRENAGVQKMINSLSSRGGRIRGLICVR